MAPAAFLAMTVRYGLHMSEQMKRSSRAAFGAEPVKEAEQCFYPVPLLAEAHSKRRQPSSI